MIDTILFDLDGTLLDTEKHYGKCWIMAAKACGYDMSREQALTMRSLGRPFAISHVKKMFGEDADYYAIREHRVKMMQDCLEKNGIEVKEGALELLSYLKENGIGRAVVTASPCETTKKNLEKVGLLSYFSDIVSAGMVEKGKPAPDVYLYACKKLGKDPSACIAIEDSPNGIMSAYKAGCKVIMVPDQTQPNETEEKLLYAKVNTLDEIITIIREMNEGGK